tara:strand:- start:97 stop:267 length:171 start_codon:yes stop_codon:yes gene_type:complete
MTKGVIELSFLGIAFLALQVWWIRMTIKNGQNEKVLDINQDHLADEKNFLEELFKK